MKRVVILLSLILLISLASAEIIINQQPQQLYSSGDVLSISVKVVASEYTRGFFLANLVCGGQTTEIHKEYMSLSSGNEKQLDISIPLTKDFIGGNSGICVVESTLKNEKVLTNNFEVSDLITINLISTKSQFNPGEGIIIEGNCQKSNSQSVEGFIEMNIVDENNNIELLESVSNGYFKLNLNLPNNFASGQHAAAVNVYEKDSEGEITNKGLLNYNIIINQIPTNVEVIFENSEVEPGTNLEVKAVLHDQTGKPISSTAIISVKNSNNKIIEQIEKPTGEILEFPIANSEPSSEWTVVAVSNKLTGESTFKILEKQDVDIQIVGNILTLTNIGNVIYDEKVTIKISDEILEVETLLKVGESKKYVLSAPNGEYQVEILKGGSESIIDEVSLTGKAIGIKEKSTFISVIKHPLVWVFIVGILGFVGFMIFRKGYKRSFIGKRSFKKEGDKKLIPISKKSLIQTRNKAELSLSIKGEKQNAGIACLHIKNLKNIETKKGALEEVLQKIVNIAEEHKTAVYENNDYIFFILAPVKTRTFKNEKTTLLVAQQITKELLNYNRLAKQKIEFGISLNDGAIIAKPEGDVLKFMSMGNLMSSSKKIASISDKEILMSAQMHEKLQTKMKTEKHLKDNFKYYSIREIRDTGSPKDKKFIHSLVEKWEKEGND